MTRHCAGAQSAQLVDLNARAAPAPTTASGGAPQLLLDDLAGDAPAATAGGS